MERNWFHNFFCNVRDFRFLLDMPNIEMLILDHNQLTAHLKLPDLPNLHTLWANNNNITNLGIGTLYLFLFCATHRNLLLGPVCNRSYSTTFRLWWNKVSFFNFTAVFISSLSKSCPSLRFLSMMNNEAAPSYFNGGTYNQYKDYRYINITHVLTSFRTGPFTQWDKASTTISIFSWRKQWVPWQQMDLFIQELASATSTAI